MIRRNRKRRRIDVADRADSLLELYYPINTPRSSPLTSDENTSSSSSTRQFETDTPIADSYNEPYEEPQQQNILTNRSSTQVGDDVIYFVSFTLYHGIAMNECKRLMDLIQVASGSESRVSCADLRATMERLARPFDVNQMYFCPHCYGTLSGPRGLCTSQDCRLRGANLKRSTSMRRDENAVSVIERSIERVMLGMTRLTQSINLTLALKSYSVPSRCEHSRFLTTVDFFRTVLKWICFTPSSIMEYAVRIRGRAKRTSLTDFPEHIVEELIAFSVEALGLQASELSVGRLEDFQGTNNSFWISLGADERERSEEWWRRYSVCATWRADARKAIAYALDDLRSYEVVEGQLVPPKKKKSIRIADENV